MKHFTLLIAAFTLIFSGCANTAPQSTDVPDTMSSTSAKSAEWVTINKETFWHNDANFQDDSYNFPSIAFEYPDGWGFECCVDMDHGSLHHICPANKQHPEMIDCDDRSIEIMDFALMGCPSSGKWDCGMDGTVPKTAKEKYEDEVMNVRDLPTAKIHPPVRLPGLGVDAFVHELSDGAHRYIVNLGDDVIAIELSADVVADEAVLTKFLSSIRRDTK